MSTPSVAPNQGSVLWRRIFQIEQVLAATGFVVYALFVSINQRVSLWVLMTAILTVGNLLIPLAFWSRRLYVGRPLPWNWLAFSPSKSCSA